MIWMAATTPLDWNFWITEGGCLGIFMVLEDIIGVARLLHLENLLEGLLQT